MGRAALWADIATALRDEIAEGRHKPGDKLPTEADLARRFGVNRHTVRRALAALHADGLTHARRGAGVFVLARPTPYRIGARVRFHDNLATAGRTAERETLRLETVPADAREAAALALAPGAPVHVWEGIALADGAPISLFRSAFPAAALPGLPEGLRQTGSVTRALAREGVADYTRASTELTAVSARPAQAAQLKLPPSAALLRSVSVNAGPDGAPVEYGRTWFAGDRVRLQVGD